MLTDSAVLLRARWQAIFAVVFSALLFLAPSTALGQAQILEATAGLPDFDARTGSVAPTSTQLAIVSNLGATAQWNEFGTPKSLIKHGGYLATGLGGDSAVTAARSWIDANKALYRLASTDGLVLYGDSRMPFSDSHAVHFKQTFGGLTAAQDGLITVGITGTPAGGWKVGYVSSSLTGDTTLGGAVRLSPQEAWLRAATDLGRVVSLAVHRRRQQPTASGRFSAWRDLAMCSGPASSPCPHPPAESGQRSRRSSLTTGAAR